MLKSGCYTLHQLYYLAFYVHYSLFNMKKIRGEYRINFNEYAQLRNAISLEEYDKMIKYELQKSVLSKVVELDCIEVTKNKERYDEIRYDAEFNVISNKEIKELLEFIRENKLDLQPEFYYELLNKLTKYE